LPAVSLSLVEAATESEGLRPPHQRRWSILRLLWWYVGKEGSL